MLLKKIIAWLLILLISLFLNLTSLKSKTSAAEILVTVNNLQTHDRSPEITGTVSDSNALVWIEVGGQYLGAIVNGNDWVIPKNSLSPLDDGVYNIHVTAWNDITGDIGYDQTENELIISDDYSEPPLFNLTDIDSANNSNYLIAGTTEPGSMVFFQITDNIHDPINPLPSIANNAGNFSLYVDLSNLCDGPIFFSAFAIDSSSKENKSEIIVKQTDKDTATLAQPVVNIYHYINSDNKTHVLISGNATSNSEINFYALDQNKNKVGKIINTETDGSFSFQVDLSGLIDGSVMAIIYNKNTSGEISKNVFNTLEKDTQAPMAPLVNNTLVRTNNAGAYPFSGTSEPNAKILFAITDGVHTLDNQLVDANDSGDFSAILDLSSFAEGYLQVYAHAIDKAGNMSTATELLLIKDTVVPYITDLDIDMLITQANLNKVTIKGNAEVLSKVYYFISDGETSLNGNIQADDFGYFAAYLDFSQFKDGQIYVNVYSVDLAGERSSDTTVITVKNSTVPIVLSLPSSISYTTKFAFSGTTTPNSKVKYTISDGTNSQTGSGASDNNGKFAFSDIDLSQLLAGQLKLSVTVTDSLCNQNTVEKTFIKENPMESIIISEAGAGEIAEVTPGTLPVAGQSVFLYFASIIIGAEISHKLAIKKSP